MQLYSSGRSPTPPLQTEPNRLQTEEGRGEDTSTNAARMVSNTMSQLQVYSWSVLIRRSLLLRTLQVSCKAVLAGRGH